MQCKCPKKKLIVSFPLNLLSKSTSSSLLSPILIIVLNLLCCFNNRNDCIYIHFADDIWYGLV